MILRAFYAPDEALASAPAPEAPPAADTPAPVVDTPQGQEAAPEALDAQLAAIWDKHNPERGADGKFASRLPAQLPNPDQTQIPTPEPARPAIDAPVSWSAEMKARWNALPPEAQTYVAQRETAVTQQITRMGKQLAQYQPLGELYEANRATFDRQGVDFPTGVRLLIEAQAMLDKDPVSGLSAIAQQYGVDLRKLAGQPAQPGQTDPTVTALQQTVARLERSQSERETRERQDKQQQEAALQASTNQEVSGWAKDKPHFNDVRSLMASLIAIGQADTLDQAYEMATHANPAVRTRVTEESRKAEEAKRLQSQSADASKAKRDAALNLGARTASPAASGKWDSDENLERVYARAQAG